MTAPPPLTANQLGIPRLLHFVWIGPPMPAWARQNIEEFKRLNPGYGVWIHGESVLLEKYSVAYDAATELCTKADLLRYSALQRYGGWYFDVDFWPFRAIDDIATAYQLDGATAFVAEQHGNKNKELTHNNAVLGVRHDAPIWARVDEYIAEHIPPRERCRYGPRMITDLVRQCPSRFTVADWPWFYPAAIGAAGRAYQACRNDGNRYARRLAPTGGQLPFAMHLWANGGDIPTVVVSRRDRFATLPSPPAGAEFSGVRVTFPMMQIQWEDAMQPFRYVAEGLTAIGCEVDVPCTGDDADLTRADLLVCWNGRKGQFLKWTREARRIGIPILHLEHGFFDRRAYTQCDHQGILHWSSWAKSCDRPAPECGAERLAAVWPRPLAPFHGRAGYVLVIGQVPGDAQLDESEIALSTPLEKMVARSLPKGVPAFFRPHPRVRKDARVRYLPRCEAGSVEEAIAGARFVVTINSNTGNECLAMGCPVLCFGPAIYALAGVAKRTTVSKFADAIREMLDGWRPETDRVRNYLHWLACRQWNGQEFRAGGVLAERLREALGNGNGTRPS